MAETDRPLPSSPAVNAGELVSEKSPADIARELGSENELLQAARRMINAVLTQAALDGKSPTLWWSPEGKAHYFIWPTDPQERAAKLEWLQAQGYTTTWPDPAAGLRLGPPSADEQSAEPRPRTRRPRGRGRPPVFSSADDFWKKLRRAVGKVYDEDEVTAAKVADYWTDNLHYYRDRRREGKVATCSADQVYAWCQEFLKKPFADLVREILTPGWEHEYFHRQ